MNFALSPLFRDSVHLLVLAAVFLQRPADGNQRPYRTKDLRLCNATITWTTFIEPVTLRLPEIRLKTLGRPILCQYTLLGSSQQRISLRLFGLQAGRYVESSRSCKDGYLMIWDGSRQPGHHIYPPNTFCGKYNNYDVIDVLRVSSGSRAEMEFYVSAATSTTSFQMQLSYIDLGNATAVDRYPKQLQTTMERLEETASVCSWRIRIDRCQLECPLISPGYPGIYPPSTECFYHVTSQDSNEIFQIKASGLSDKPREFNLQKDCQTDYVEVYEGQRKQNGKKIGRFCGQDFPNITTATNQLTVFFVSGFSTPPYNYTGFHLSVIGITKEWHKDGYQLPKTMCSWTFNATAGSVSSPEHWLPRKTMCQYGFYTSPGYYLELIIHVYGLQHNCQDYIQVVDGLNALPPLCERTLKQSHQTFTYNLTSPKVLVRYFITSGQMEAEQSRGFWLSYRQIPDPAYLARVTESSQTPQPVVDYISNGGLARVQPLTYLSVPSVIALAQQLKLTPAP